MREKHKVLDILEQRVTSLVYLPCARARLVRGGGACYNRANRKQLWDRHKAMPAFTEAEYDAVYQRLDAEADA